MNIVADGRDMSVEDVKKLADGRTYTAKQAKNNGLIDEISLYPDMKDAMSKNLEHLHFYEMESDEGIFAVAVFQSRIISSEVRSAGSDGNRQKCRKRGADVLCRTVTIIRRS